jgi:hypothetical protein
MSEDLDPQVMASLSKQRILEESGLRKIGLQDHGEHEESRAERGDGTGVWWGCLQSQPGVGDG